MLNNILIALGIKKHTVDSVLDTFETAAVRLRDIVDQKDAEAASLRSKAAELVVAANTADTEAARAHRTAVRLDELTA